MKDLKLNDNGDLAIENGDLVIIQDSEQIEQHVKLRLKTFYGEWFADTSEGVKYFEEILIKGYNKEIVDSILKATIVETPGIVELVSYSSTINDEERTLIIEAEYYDEYNVTNTLEEILP